MLESQMMSQSRSIQKFQCKQRVTNDEAGEVTLENQKDTLESYFIKFVLREVR